MTVVNSVAMSWFVNALTGRVDDGASVRFVRRGSTRFLILKTLADEDTARVDLAVQDGTLVFTDTGDVHVPQADGHGIVARNPLVDDALRSLGGRPLSELRADTVNQYVWGVDAVVNRTLRYLLLKDGGKWQLCHNPLHERPFRDYYTQMTQDVDSAWGNPDATTTHPTSMRQLLQHYCNDLVVVHDGHASYLDPTCNIFYSKQQCVESAFLPGFENRVDHGASSERQRIFDLNTDHAAFLNATGPTWGANCLCTGNAAAYANSNLSTDSFLMHEPTHKPSSFVGRRTCALDFVINNSNVVIDTGGGDLDILNSNIEAQSTSNVVVDKAEPPSTDADNDVPTPDPPSTDASGPVDSSNGGTRAPLDALVAQAKTHPLTCAAAAVGLMAGAYRLLAPRPRVTTTATPRYDYYA